MTLYIYAGKDEVLEENEEGTKLSKSAQVVAKLCESLPTNAGHKLFFDNSFSTLDLMLYLQQKGILACGTIRVNRLKKCPLKKTKELQSNGSRYGAGIEHLRQHFFRSSYPCQLVTRL